MNSRDYITHRLILRRMACVMSLAFVMFGVVLLVGVSLLISYTDCISKSVALSSIGISFSVMFVGSYATAAFYTLVLEESYNRIGSCVGIGDPDNLLHKRDDTLNSDNQNDDSSQTHSMNHFEKIVNVLLVLFFVMFFVLLFIHSM